MLALAAVLAVTVALGWQFMADASRAVPALDTAWYQWRAELLQAREPVSLITAKGAQASLAGGYRVAEPVLAALIRTVGGVGPATPTVLLSVVLRAVVALGLAAFAWRHRRDPPLLFLTLAVVPALFLLQRFFGFLDNYLTLALLAGVLLLLDAVRASWTARAAVVALLLLGGLSHPTTVGLFLGSYGAVVLYRAARDRSVAAAAREHGAFVLAAAAGVALTAAFWLGGLWGRSAGFGEAAVPPPQPVSYFVDRSLNVLGNMTPWALVPLLVVGAGSLVLSLRRSCSDSLAEVTLAWALPLAGMLGFLVGAAYPYFRFFNATLAPPLLVAVGILAAVRAAGRLPRPRALPAPAALAVVGAAVLVSGWWVAGLSEWTSARTWLTPEVREPLAAADAYLEAEPDRRAVFVVDAEPEGTVPYGIYKEGANAILASLAGERIDRAVVFFGRVEDLRAGHPTASGDEQYDALSRDSAAEALPWMDRHAERLALLVPMALNDSPNRAALADGCVDGLCGASVGESELLILPASGAAAPAGVEAARRAAAEARAFVADPPGPLRDLGGTLLATLRLGLLLLLPGWLLVRGIPGLGRVETMALVPIVGAAAVTTVGVVALAVLRGPLTPAVGWSIWAIAVALGLAAARARGRAAPSAATG